MTPSPVASTRSDPSAPVALPLVERQRVLLRELARLISERARRAPAIEREYQQRTQGAEAEFAEANRAITAAFTIAREEADRELRETNAGIIARFEAEQDQTRQTLAK